MCIRDSATIFGNVVAMAPMIQTQALEDEHSQLPRLCSEALSTTAPSPAVLSGCASFGSTADRRSFRQLPA